MTALELRGSLLLAEDGSIDMPSMSMPALCWRVWVLGQGVEDGAGGVSFEAAKGVHSALTLSLFAREVAAGGRVQASLVDGQAVQREVELAVAAAVQAEAVSAARRCGDRGDTRGASELRVGGEALGAGGLGNELGGGQRSAAGKLEQRRAMTRSSWWSSSSLISSACSSKNAAGSVSTPSLSAARATAIASMGSDLPR